MIYSCKICSINFKHKSSLKRHILNNKCNEYSNKSFICEKCNNKYSSKIALNKHIKLKHSNEPKKIIENVTKCPLCSKEFSNKYNLKRHLITTCKNSNGKYIYKKINE